MNVLHAADWRRMTRPNLVGKLVVVKQEPRMYVGLLDWVEIPENLEQAGSIVRIHLQWCAIGPWSSHENHKTPLIYSEWFSCVSLNPHEVRPYHIGEAGAMISFVYGHLAIDPRPDRAGLDREIRGLPAAQRAQIWKPA